MVPPPRAAGRLFFISNLALCVVALDDPDYWLEKYLAEAECGTRNRAALMLACQLRDNRISKSEAKRTMKRFAEEAPRCDHPFTEREALSALRSAWSREPRAPVELEEGEGSSLERRARKRERELLEKFKRDPLSLGKMEKKRLKESPVAPPMRLLQIELAKEEMSGEEKRRYRSLMNEDEKEAQKLVLEGLHRRSNKSNLHGQKRDNDETHAQGRKRDR